MTNYDVERVIQMAMQKGSFRLILILGIILLIFVFVPSIGFGSGRAREALFWILALSRRRCSAKGCTSGYL